MKAAVLYGPFDLRIEEVEKPKVSFGEVLLEVKATGIRGTDVGIYAGLKKVGYPRIIGHEFAGKVSKVGEGVTRVKVGDRVVSDTVFSCGKCYLCQKGRRNLCVNGGIYGREKDGSYAEYIVVPDSACFKLPDNIAYEEATLLEMLATVYRGQKRVRINPGETVFVIGLGLAGFLHLQLARVHGADPVIVSEVIPWKLNLATKLGAKFTINPSQENASQRIIELTSGRGAQVVIDAVGIPVTVKLTLEAVQPGGRVLLFGITTKKVDGFDASPFYFKEIEVIGTRGLIGEEFEPIIKLVSSGAIDLRSLTMEKYSINQLKTALDSHYKHPDKFKILSFP